MALIDLFAILPFYLSFFFTIDLRFLRVLRLLRVLKLTRYSSAMSMLLDVLRRESNTFFASFFLLLVLLILAASGAYIVEHGAQPEKFGSIPHAMWWAIITLTSVCYGDVSPITPIGKLFGSLVSVIGVGIAALPAGILASGLASQVRRNRVEMRDKLKQILEDEIIEPSEELEMRALQKKLSISDPELEKIKLEVAARANRNNCPHCGGAIDFS